MLTEEAWTKDGKGERFHGSPLGSAGAVCYGSMVPRLSVSTSVLRGWWTCRTTFAQLRDVSITVQLPLGQSIAALDGVGGGTYDEFDRLPSPEERAGALPGPGPFLFSGSPAYGFRRGRWLRS